MYSSNMDAPIYMGGYNTMPFHVAEFLNKDHWK